MILSELITIYDLHDSMIESIDVDSLPHKIIINITLCNWRQRNYSKDEPELIDAAVVFEDVSEFAMDPNCPYFDGDEILHSEIIGENGKEKLKIVAYDGKNIKLILISARNVILNS